jgi:dihydrofolate synthase/folylpolyglutamate synthase
MLIESGYSTGAFFSPFVYDPRERIQIGRKLIPKRIFALLTEWIQPFAESLTDTEFEGVTEFEFKTAMGFQFWKEMAADWVALEVGLGGRLDSTNIVSPRCSVVVSIGMDHTHILGDSYMKIAREKGGIIKPGVPAVLGEMPQPALETLMSIAKERGCDAWVYGKEITWESGAVVTPCGKHADLHPGIMGAAQPHNLALAVAAMDAAGATTTLGGLQRGARDAWIPGRMQRVHAEGRNWLLDGAHNRESAVTLHESLAELTPKPECTLLITGMVQGHDSDSFYPELEGIVDEAVFVPIDYHRSVPPEQLFASAGRYFKKSSPFKSLESAIQYAVEVTGPKDLILVTGSFYLVGEVGRMLGVGSE